MKLLNFIFSILYFAAIIFLQLLIPTVLIRYAVIRLAGIYLDLGGIFLAIAALYAIRIFIFNYSSDED